MPRKLRTKRRKVRAFRARIILAVLIVSLIFASVLGFFAASAIFASATADLPSVDKPQLNIASKTRIWSADGKLLAELYAENRNPVRLSQISPYFTKAIIATEDERYYQHQGFDLYSIARAVVTDIRTGKASQGASTITQQFVRAAYLNRQKTFLRKLREMVLAYKLEKKYKKDQILNMYLNAIYFGEGAYGIQSASHIYFSKDAKHLSLTEAALLAGLPQRPIAYDPFTNPKDARARRTVVLGRMVANSVITSAQAAKADKAPLGLHRGVVQQAMRAPYFVEFVKQQLLRKYGADKVFKGGMQVYTTLDTRLQALAERTVKNTLPYPGDPDASLTSIEPKTGYIRAMYGGRDFAKQKFNFAAQGQRQPGSSFKTFVLVACLEDGIPPYRYVRSDSPITIAMPKPQKPWVVNNSEGSGQGLVSIEHGLTASINVVFAQLIMDVGAGRVARLAKRMGIMSPVPPVPAIALGGLSPGVTTFDMSTAYSTLANGGVHVQPTAIVKIVVPGGTVLYKNKPDRTRAISPAVAKAAVDLLKGVITGGTGTAADIGREAAGKTGTSQNYRDAWFCGFTPQLSTAVWVGYAKTEKSMTSVHGIRVFGGTFPAQIWHDFMSSALQGQPDLSFQNAPALKYRWDSSWKSAADVPPPPPPPNQNKNQNKTNKPSSNPKPSGGGGGGASSGGGGGGGAHP
jgi:penicillin-binding protein 1A